MQNLVGDTDYVFKITLYDDEGIATIDKEEVYVPVGSDGTPVINLNFKIPEDAEVGHVYDIHLNFRGIPDGRVGGGGVGGIGFNRKMPITVIEGEPTQKGQFPKETIESQTNIFWYLVIALVIAGVVGYFVIRKSGSKKQSTKTRK